MCVVLDEFVLPQIVPREIPRFFEEESLKVTIRVSMVPRAIKLAAKEEMDLKSYKIKIHKSDRRICW